MNKIRGTSTSLDKYAYHSLWKYIISRCLHRFTTMAFSIETITQSIILLSFVFHKPPLFIFYYIPRYQVVGFFYILITRFKFNMLL